MAPPCSADAGYCCSAYPYAPNPVACGLLKDDLEASVLTAACAYRSVACAGGGMCNVGLAGVELGT